MIVRYNRRDRPRRIPHSFIIFFEQETVHKTKDSNVRYFVYGSSITMTDNYSCLEKNSRLINLLSFRDIAHLCN